MPETPHHAFEMTVSLRDHVTETMRLQIKEYMEKNCLWYALKAETGESGKCHLHGYLVFEICNSVRGGGAKTISNLKRSLALGCPTLQNYLVETPSQYALFIKTGTSTQFVAEYLQKEAELSVHKLPEDLQMLQPYFADLQAKKPKNPGYDAARKQYLNEEREYPATHESVWEFLNYHMFVDEEAESAMTVMADLRKLREKCIFLLAYINGEALPMPNFTGCKRPSAGDTRFCPRCEDEGRDVPGLLGPREQFCKICKKY
jgi:hypothetical protein